MCARGHVRVGLFHQNHERPWIPAEATDDWRNHYEGGYAGLAASYAAAIITNNDGEDTARTGECKWDYVLRHYEFQPLRELAPFVYVPLGPANAEELDARRATERIAQLLAEIAQLSAEFDTHSVKDRVDDRWIDETRKEWWKRQRETRHLAEQRERGFHVCLCGDSSMQSGFCGKMFRLFFS